METTTVETGEVFHRLGLITRQLHDALQQLGYDKKIKHAVHEMPDARSRLDYIARLTGEAAHKVLNSVDIAHQLQADINQFASKLRATLATSTSPSPESIETMQFLDSLEKNSNLHKETLSDIVLAQDFHDLTGQVICRVVEMASRLEEQLLQLLLETTPHVQRGKVNSIKLAGPVVASKGREDVVTSQAQVDALLESLGF